MKILAFDTTNSGMSVAILDKDQIVENQDILESGIQAERLIPTIEECLNKNNIWYQDLDLLAITKGPGSFTGVRVGFSAAKAIELSAKLPLVTFNSLMVIAYNYKSGIYQNDKYEKILVVMDAKLDEFFIQEFSLFNNKLESIYEPKIISEEQIIDFLPRKKFLLAGSAKLLITEKVKDKNLILSKENDYIKADNLAFLAKEIYQNKVPESDDSDILYIRKPRISKRKK